MAVPQSAKLECLIQESEALRSNFQFAIRPTNLKAYFEGAFFELSPYELQTLPEFSKFDRRIDFYTLIKDSIIEFNDNVFRFIETEEHLRRYLTGVLINIEKLQKKLSCFLLGNLSEYEIVKRLSDQQTQEMVEDLHYVKQTKTPDPNYQPSETIEKFVTDNDPIRLHSYRTMKYVFTCNFIEVEFERLRRLVNEQIEKNNQTITKNELTHRQHAIIRKYLIDAKYITNEFNRVEITNAFGKKREQHIDGVNEHSKTYKKITAKELEAVLPHLEAYPNAHKAATNDLAKLN